MAKAGSCKIGFKPRPSSTTIEFTRNGFEVKIIKKQKIIILLLLKFMQNMTKIIYLHL